MVCVLIDLSLHFPGILIDLETDSLEEASDGFTEAYDEITKEAISYLNKLLDMENTMMEHYKVPTTVVDGKRYGTVINSMQKVLYFFNPYKESNL